MKLYEDKNTMNTIKTFKGKVDYCKTNLAPDIISNSDEDHALYLFKNLLDVAVEQNENVRIISGSMRPSFYNKLASKFDAIINAGLTIELLILQSDIKIESSLIAQKIEDYENGEVVQAPSGYALNAQHMLLIGDKGQRYRLEINHENTQATASFNSSNMGMGELLISLFKNTKKILRTPPKDQSSTLPA